MNRYRRVGVVFRKELIDTLRDRRTLIAMIVVPIVLYPALMMVIVEALKSEAGRQGQQHYRVCVPDVLHKQWLEGVLAREEQDRKSREQDAETAAKTVGRELDQGMSALRTRLGSDQITVEIAEPGKALWDSVKDQSYHVGVLVSPAPSADNFADRQNRVVQIIYSDTNPLSDVLNRQLSSILSHEADRIVKARVTALAGSQDALNPLVGVTVSTSTPARQFAKVLAMIVPFLLVTMTVTGAMYPAIDLTAGERERGTLETLAVSPVPVGQIVAGKFGVIVAIAMATTTLNLASMTAVVHFGKLDKVFAGAAAGSPGEEMAAEAFLRETKDDSGSNLRQVQQENLDRRRALEDEAKQQVTFLTTAAPIVLLSMVPFAVLFGAIMLAACSFARTFKEAQNYMMPVMMAAIVPAMIVSYMPTIKLQGPMLVLPVANVVVLIRELLLGNYDVSAIAICLLSTCFYAAAAVVVANKLYGHEAVLFSDVGSYKSLLLRRFLQPLTYPPASLALLAVALIFPINFYVQSSLLDADSSPLRFDMVIAATQLLLFAAPAILLSWYAKIDIRRTFSLRLPSARHFIGAVLMAASVVPVSNLLQHIQFYFFPPSEVGAELIKQQMRLFEGQPLALLILVIALLPAICEELLFRGFLLGALRERLSLFQTIVVVGLIFGLYHMYLEKLAIVALLGMVLSLICIRSGSIFLAMLVHLANNGLMAASLKDVRLQKFFGLVVEEAIPRIHFDVRTGVFISTFLIGLALIAAGRHSKKTIVLS